MIALDKISPSHCNVWKFQRKLLFYTLNMFQGKIGSDHLKEFPGRSPNVLTSYDFLNPPPFSLYFDSDPQECLIHRNSYARQWLYNLRVQRCFWVRILRNDINLESNLYCSDAAGLRTRGSLFRFMKFFEGFALMAWNAFLNYFQKVIFSALQFWRRTSVWFIILEGFYTHSRQSWKN